MGLTNDTISKSQSVFVYSFKNVRKNFIMVAQAQIIAMIVLQSLNSLYALYFLLNADPILTVVTHAAQVHLKCHHCLGAEIVTVFKHIRIIIYTIYLIIYYIKNINSFI